jgi:hypothetical protein
MCKLAISGRKQIAIKYSRLNIGMSREKKNPLKRDQALNDATSGQMGEEPRAVPVNQPDEEHKDSRVKAARKLSREIY